MLHQKVWKFRTLATFITTRYSGLYFLGQISIMADSNPIFTTSIYAIMLERSVSLRQKQCRKQPWLQSNTGKDVNKTLGLKDPPSACAFNVQFLGVKGPRIGYNLVGSKRHDIR